MKYSLLLVILALLNSCDEHQETIAPIVFHDELAGAVIDLPVLSFVEELSPGELFVELVYDGEQFELWKGPDRMISGKNFEELGEALKEAKEWMDSEGFSPKIVWVVPQSMVFDEINRLYYIAQKYGCIYFYFSVKSEEGESLGRVLPLRGMWMSDRAPELLIRNDGMLEVVQGEKHWVIESPKEGSGDVVVAIKRLIKDGFAGFGEDRRMRIRFGGKKTCQEVLEVVASLRRSDLDVFYFPDELWFEKLWSEEVVPETE